jgi:hypothetical protein
MAPRRAQPVPPDGDVPAYETSAPTGGSSGTGPTHTGRAPSRSGQRYEQDPETGEWYQVGPAPIGVAPDYVGPGSQMTSRGVLEGLPGRTLPRYFDGDEWSIFLGLSPETIAGMQEAMQEAGYISVNATLNYGRWDGTTASAMREILAVANAEGQDWQVAFETAVADAVGSGYLTAERQSDAEALAEAERARQPTPLPPPMLANPDELRAVVDQVSRRVLGRKADEAFVNKFVSEYQTYESTRYYNQHWDPDQQRWVQQNTTQATPADLAAEKALLGDAGDEAGAYALLETMGNFESLLSGPFGAS